MTVKLLRDQIGRALASTMTIREEYWSLDAPNARWGIAQVVNSLQYSRIMTAIAEWDINSKGNNRKFNTIWKKGLFYSWNAIIARKGVRSSTMIVNAVSISVNYACSSHSHAHDLNHQIIDMNEILIILILGASLNVLMFSFDPFE